MMLADCSSDFNKQNKWKHQRIHKKYNKIQYASKHYGISKLIQKRKNPVKQRKQRKKFKVQRNRKKIYKRMAFDYDDFLHKNKNENHKRIQTRPTISYYQCLTETFDINSTFVNYYNETPPTQIETIFGDDIPIWQCDACTYINIEKLEFCSMCNNPFKYDYDNNGFNNERFYSIKYVPVKYKSNTKSKKASSVKIKKESKNNYNDFETYWNGMMKSQKKYEASKIEIHRKMKTYRNKSDNMNTENKYKLIIVVSINNKKNGLFSMNYKSCVVRKAHKNDLWFYNKKNRFCKNYKSKPMYVRIAHKNDLYFDPIIIGQIHHYYPFYHIPICLAPKMYQDLSKNSKLLSSELSLIVRKIKQQCQRQLLKTNDMLKQMINSYKTSQHAEKKCAINPAKILASVQNVVKPTEPTNNYPTFDVQLDVLLYKTNVSRTCNNLNRCNKQLACNGMPNIPEIKQEMFLLKEINVKTYNEISFPNRKTMQHMFDSYAAKQTNILFDMFQDEESEQELEAEKLYEPKNKSYTFIFSNEYDRNVDICSSLETFSSLSNYYRVEYRQFDVHNKRILNIAKQCLDIIFENMDDTSESDNCQFRFDEKHIPHYNLLPLSFRISRILYQYLPAMDIIRNICVPMIGYDQMYYVTINTQIRYLQRNKFADIGVQTDSCPSETKTNVVDDCDIATSYSPIYNQLIQMGFDGEQSLEAAKKYSNNINNAIDWIRNMRVINTKKKKVVKYNYDVNWEAIAVYEEEEEESASSSCGCLFGGCGRRGCNRYSSSDSSSDDSD